jgi:hypothetical protein
MELPNLFQCSYELRSGNDFLSGRNSGEAAFLILHLPLKQQAGLKIVQECDVEDIHARPYCLLNNPARAGISPSSKRSPWSM